MGIFKTVKIRNLKQGEAKASFVTDIIPVLMKYEGIDKSDAEEVAEIIFSRQRKHQLIERETHGMLCDVGLALQRTDEFVESTKLEKVFMIQWQAAVKKLRDKVLADYDNGHRQFRFE